MSTDISLLKLMLLLSTEPAGCLCSGRCSPPASAAFLIFRDRTMLFSPWKERPTPVCGAIRIRFAPPMIYSYSVTPASNPITGLRRCGCERGEAPGLAQCTLTVSHRLCHRNPHAKPQSMGTCICTCTYVHTCVPGPGFSLIVEPHMMEAWR